MKKENSPAMVPYVFDNRPPIRRGKRQNNVPPYRPGQRIPNRVAPHGGGGPENTGAKTDMQAGESFRQSQPSWNLFEDDFYGPAAPSKNAVVAGGGDVNTPSNGFRQLGDLHGGRQ